ncbi:MAG: glutathione peroxidase [Proteobacteria bacterium]|nr:glutathione peroxidase [Pseudomonadota bacterium]
MSFYDYSVKDPQDNDVSMRQFEGKVVIVVNTATGCGFTPHYKDLESMYSKYHEKGLEILDIPCNQFAGQTPGTDEEIHEFCTLHYNTEFPQMKKSDVNGENALELYTFLKSQKGFEEFGFGSKALAMSAMLKLKDTNYKKSPDIKWNFTKFIIDRHGEVVKRFEPTASMRDVEKFVESLL